VKLCSKCQRVQIKEGTCFEPCEEVEGYLRNVVEDLRVIVLQLCRRCDNEGLKERAMDYLKRKGLGPRILRKEKTL